jgi:hypothetical protein
MNGRYLAYMGDFRALKYDRRAEYYANYGVVIPFQLVCYAIVLDIYANDGVVHG